MFVLGIQDMGTDVGTYDADAGWTAANLASALGTALLVFGLLLLVLNLLSSVVAKRGDPIGADPWGGRTLEWATSSPPPPYNFDTLPEVRSDSPLVDLGPSSRQPPGVADGRRHHPRPSGGATRPPPPPSRSARPVQRRAPRPRPRSCPTAPGPSARFCSWPPTPWCSAPSSPPISR